MMLCAGRVAAKRVLSVTAAAPLCTRGQLTHFAAPPRAFHAGFSLAKPLARLGRPQLPRRPLSSAGWSETESFEKLAKLPFSLSRQLRRTLGARPAKRQVTRPKRPLMLSSEEVYLRRARCKNTTLNSGVRVQHAARGFSYKRVLRRGDGVTRKRKLKSGRLSLGGGGSSRGFSSRIPGSGGGGGRGIWGAVFTGLAVLFGKTKYLFAALKVAKFGSLISMLLSTLAYAMFFGWPFAVGMVGLIFVHEIGHAAMAIALGLPVTSMVFVPFLGAAVVMRGLEGLAAYKQVLIAIAGPVMGGLAAAAIAMVGASTNSEFFKALADFGFMVNLFNLFPVSGLDGGYILGACSRWFLLAGFSGMAYALYLGLISNPLMIIILLIGGFQTAQHFFPGTLGRPFVSPIPMTPMQKFYTGVAYLGLATSLAAAQQVNRDSLKKPPVPPQYKEYGVEEYV